MEGRRAPPPLGLRAEMSRHFLVTVQSQTSNVGSKFRMSHYRESGASRVASPPQRATPTDGPRQPGAHGVSTSPCTARERGHPGLVQRPRHQLQRRTPPAPAWPSREQCSAHGHFLGALVKADPVFSCPGTSAARVRPPGEGPAPS